MGDISAALTDMWSTVLVFVPKALAFLAILALGWMVAIAARRLVGKLLAKAGFDRLTHRGSLGRAMARSRIQGSDILARLTYYALLLVTLQLAFGVFGPNPVSNLIDGVVSWLPKAFVAIVIVVVASGIATAARDLISGALSGLSYGRLLGTTASVFITAMGIIAALNQVGIATAVTTPVLVAVLATVAGIMIVGVGGGLVRPMTQRWDRWLDRVEAESSVISERAQGFAAGRNDLDRQMADRAPASADAAMATSAGPSATAGAPGTTASSAGSGDLT
ncbi:mechanosensitive ion channel family protein [Pilimelia columellifera]|uniref:Uncharacterized protein n=1 Tax=Pilimelia columellifera subsp. columellifera TaxID=706583 RepID=A0ABN3NMK0_9ACTN